MNLSTMYLGLKLSSPLMPGASPLVNDLDLVRRLVDAGAAAIVMHSLFEEQLTGKIQPSTRRAQDMYSEWAIAPGSPGEMPRHPYATDTTHYLERIATIKRTAGVPVIASLNGATPGSWTEFAAQIQQAGADALELNVYYLPTDLEETGAAVEQRVLEIAAGVRKATTLPIAVKLSPFFSSLPHLALQLERVGVNGLVLFNRFYQPNVNAERMEPQAELHLSDYLDSSELLLRLTWVAILARRVKLSLAVTGGVHSALDAIKCVMAGAHGVQLVSALLGAGPEYLLSIRERMERWMERHGYASLAAIQDRLSHLPPEDTAEVERHEYVQTLQSRQNV